MSSEKKKKTTTRILARLGGLTVSTLHSGLLPPAVGLAAHRGGAALREPGAALVPDDGVDGVLLPPVAKHAGVLHLRRGAAGH